MSGIYVNFEKKRWLYYNWGDDHGDLLFDYDELDDLLAEPIMKMNSMKGVKTKFCCSGHYGSESTFYIFFERITKSLSKILESTGATLDQDDLKSRNHIVYRNKNIHSYTELLLFHQKLSQALQKFPNKFQQMHVIEGETDGTRYKHLITDKEFYE